MANYVTLSGIYAQTAAAIDNATALGRAFDAAKNDDTFYLPPEVFNNPDFKRGLKLFLSPDGKAARMIVTHEGDPATPEGISHIVPIAKAAHEALKGTPMAGAQVYLGGTAATYKGIQEGAKYDLMIVAFAALSLILLIMIIITRSLIAALVIVGTVALSPGASFGLSVLVWQYIFGIQVVLGRACAGGDRAPGGGIGLQPAVDFPIQGRDPRRPEDRRHPRDGRLRIGGPPPPAWFSP